MMTTKHCRMRFKKAGECGVPVAVHAEDKALLKKTEGELRGANRQDPAAFLEAHSELVETTAVERLLRLTSKVDLHLHFCHLTNEESLNAVVEGKKSGRAVTCEVTPQHLLLSTVDFERQGSLLVMLPPLRSESSVEALWKGVSEGWIDILGSDHAPHTLGEKSAVNVWDVKVGVPGLETTLSAYVDDGEKEQVIVGSCHSAAC